MKKEELLRAFRRLPGVGKAISEDLWNLGIRSLDELKTIDPENLYEELCRLQNTRVDRCMLYVFRCIVYCLNTKNPEEEKQKWWYWKE